MVHLPTGNDDDSSMIRRSPASPQAGNEAPATLGGRNRWRRVPTAARISRLALQAGIAQAVIAAALLYPLQATERIVLLVGVVLLQASVHARLAGAFV